MASKLKALLDVDVLLDVFTQRHPYYENSATLLALIERGKMKGMAAAHGLTTLFYLTAKYTSNSQARMAISELLQLLSVAVVNQQVIEQALALPMGDFEDAVQMAAAMQSGADYLVTRNVKDYKSSPLPAIRPAELIPLLGAQT